MAKRKDPIKSKNLYFYQGQLMRKIVYDRQITYEKLHFYLNYVSLTTTKSMVQRVEQNKFGLPITAWVSLVEAGVTTMDEVLNAYLSDQKLHFLNTAGLIRNEFLIYDRKKREFITTVDKEKTEKFLKYLDPL